MATENSVSMAQTILCVDDEPSNRALMARLLKNSGYDVHQAASSRGAIEGAGRSKVALILLDIHMPETDGFETLKLLKSDTVTAKIPVIVMSGTAVPEVARKIALELGAHDFISFPTEDENVLAVVRKVLAA